MEKIFNKFIFCLSIFSTLGCHNDTGSRYLKDIATGTGFKNIADGKILFFFNGLTGWDASGSLYYVLDYSNVDDNIRFTNTTSKERFFLSGRDSKFESIVDDFVLDKLSNNYNYFEEKYKIDWNQPYIYYSANEEYVGTAMIYYKETELLYVLSYIVG
ncbi:MAG: hypothetical protein K6E21_00240 [Bacilli bacterium]|nr:hypothetical protein [Bacilli bacterium]